MATPAAVVDLILDNIHDAVYATNRVIGPGNGGQTPRS
jgi:hypothetical protein